MGKTLDSDRDQLSPTNEPEEVRLFPLSSILWITVYGLMMLAFDWEAGFQFNASPSAVNRTLAGSLSAIGFVFCLKIVWKELTSLKAAKMSPAQLAAVAKKGAAARWGKKVVRKKARD
jgi:hypothetical protein